MPETTICPVCKNAVTRSPVLVDIHLLTIDCPRCGLYQISDWAEFVFNSGDYSVGVESFAITNRQRAIASSTIRESGKYYNVNRDNHILLLGIQDKSTAEKMNNLLQWFEQQDTNGLLFIKHPPLKDLKLQAKCWASNANELTTLVYLLVRRNLLNVYESNEQIPLLYKNDGNIYAFPLYSITPEGWEHLERLRAINPDSSQGFVAMQFNKEMDKKFETIFKPAIKAAGYIAHRVDKSEHNNKIDDEIILQIRRSRFIVADLTGMNAGAYFELGFAEGLGLTCFQTCRGIEDLHFDRRQQNSIIWGDMSDEEFRTALARRIEATVGHGPIR